MSHHPALQHFEGKPLRIVMRAGEPWFVAPDVCRILGMSDVTSALRVLDDDEKGPLTVRTLGGDQSINGLSEPGLYKLMARSRKPEARRFDRWVRHEVLPAIRRTGSYGVPDVQQALSDPATLRGLLAGYTDKVIAQQAQIAVLAPKADALDRISGTAGSLSLRDTAKALDMAPAGLIEWMLRHHWIYRNGQTKALAAYQAKIDAGLMGHRGQTKTSAAGQDFTISQAVVTAAGLAKLAVALGRAMPSTAFAGVQVDVEPILPTDREWMVRRLGAGKFVLAKMDFRHPGDTESRKCFILLPSDAAPQDKPQGRLNRITVAPRGYMPPARQKRLAAPVAPAQQINGERHDA